MKRITIIFLALALHLVATEPPKILFGPTITVPFELWHATHHRTTLQGIALVEHVTDPAKPGDAGELGYHRITPGVWAQHTTAPFIWAGTDEALELWVAQRHLDWLERGLLAQHPRPVSPYWLALAWNAGLTATLRGETTAAQRDYAQRVQNLCQESIQSHP